MKKKQKEPFKIAVCILLFNEEGKILGVSRKDNPEDIGLPGGKIEVEEQTIDAVKRELFEETGLILKDPQWLMSADDEFGYFVIAFTGEYEGIPENKEEGVIVDWFDWEDIEKGTFGNYNKRLHERYNIRENEGLQERKFKATSLVGK